MDEGHTRFTSYSLLFAVEANLTGIAERLSRSGLIYELHCGERGTILHIATENKNHELLRILVRRFPSIIEEPNSQGQTPLEKAWELRDYESIGIMLEASAYILSSSNQKPFFALAILENDPALAKKIISNITEVSLIGSRAGNVTEEFLIDLLEGRGTKLRREVFKGFGGSVLETALQANSDQVVRTLLRESFDIDFDIKILTTSTGDFDLGFKLSEIVSEMDSSDLSLETLTLLLAKAFQAGHVQLLTTVMDKFLELIKTNQFSVHKFPRLLVLICEKSARFSAVDEQTLLIIKELSKHNIDEEYKDWLTRLLNSLAENNNFTIINRLVEEEQLRSIISPTGFLNLLCHALRLDDFKLVETLLGYLPEECRNINPDTLISFFNFSNRLHRDAP